MHTGISKQIELFPFLLSSLSIHDCFSPLDPWSVGSSYSWARTIARSLRIRDLDSIRAIGANKSALGKGQRHVECNDEDGSNATGLREGTDLPRAGIVERRGDPIVPSLLFLRYTSEHIKHVEPPGDHEVGISLSNLPRSGTSPRLSIFPLRIIPARD